MAITRAHPVLHQFLVSAKLPGQIIIEPNKSYRIWVDYVSIESKYFNNVESGVGDDFFVGELGGSYVAPSILFKNHLRIKVGGSVIPILIHSSFQKPPLLPFAVLTTNPVSETEPSIAGPLVTLKKGPKASSNEEAISASSSCSGTRICSPSHHHPRR